MELFFLQILICVSLFSFEIRWSAHCVEIIQAQFSQYATLKCGGSVVCLGSKPAKSFGASSQGQCALACNRQRQEPESHCVGVNYRQENNVCDMFFDVNDLMNFTKNEPGCHYMQVSECINKPCTTSFSVYHCVKSARFVYQVIISPEFIT